MPHSLAKEVRRIAKERDVTVSKALVSLAEKGLQAEAAARLELQSAYQGFLKETDPARRSAAGISLIRTIFGADSIAEDSVR